MHEYGPATTASGPLWTSELPEATAPSRLRNINADASNRLAVKSNAALFSHDDVTPGTGDLLIKMNKAAAARDARLVL